MYLLVILNKYLLTPLMLLFWVDHEVAHVTDSVSQVILNTYRSPYFTVFMGYTLIIDIKKKER